MRPEERTLWELFREAAGKRDEFDLANGVKVRLTIRGNVIVNDRELGELSSHAVEDLARELRRAAEDRYLDPVRNEFIKFEPD